MGLETHSVSISPPENEVFSIGQPVYAVDANNKGKRGGGKSKTFDPEGFPHSKPQPERIEQISCENSDDEDRTSSSTARRGQRKAN